MAARVQMSWRSFALLPAFFLVALFLFLPSVSSAAGISLTPKTWNVIGLDSTASGVPTGPDTFPVGAKVCNTSGSDLTDLQTALQWNSSNAYINVQGPSSKTIGFLASGECTNTYYLVKVTKDPAAWSTARKYQIVATATGASGETPISRELYVDKLERQNRNSTKKIAGEGGCNIDYTICDPAPTDLVVGQEYTYKLYAETASAYGQLESFLTFPGNIFRIEQVSSEYQIPAGATEDGPYADACGWDNEPASSNYRSCVGPIPAQYQPHGKAGGRVVVTYRVKIIGTGSGSGSLTSLIYDASGGSIHYNKDFGDTTLDIDYNVKYPLDVTVNGDGNVSSDVGGVNCGAGGANCDQSYNDGTLVLLTATPSAGSSFTSWGGACAQATPQPPDPGPYTCQVTMNQAQSVVANFEGQSSWPLNVSVIGGGDVTSDTGGIDCPDTLCDKSYVDGTLVTLTAEARTGWEFKGWGQDCLGSTPIPPDPGPYTCQVTMDQARSAQAIFVALLPDIYNVVVDVQPDQGGTVTSVSAPPQTPEFDCGQICSIEYESGDQITFTGTPNPGWKAVSWDDDCTGVDPGADCNVTVDSNKSIVYKLQPINPRLAISVTPLRKVVWRGQKVGWKTYFKNRGPVTALSARPCLLPDPRMKLVSTDGGTLQPDGRVCWSKKDMATGESRVYYPVYRMVSASPHKAKAIGVAANAPPVRDVGKVRVKEVSRPEPQKPTG